MHKFFQASYVWLFVLLVYLSAFTACSIQKYVSPENPVYSGASVEITTPDSVPNAKALQSALESEVIIEPTGKIAMWWWFKLQTDKEKGLKYRLRSTFGDEPIYYSDDPLMRSALLMQDYLKDHGYFGASVKLDTSRPKPYQVAATFSVRADGRARIDTVRLPPDSIDFASFIKDNRANSLVKEGEYYSIAALSAERVRIDQLASRSGYFEFAPSNLFYFVDSTAAPNQVEIFMRLDAGNDSLALQRYRIGQTYIFPEYTIGDTVTRTADTLVFEDIHVISSPDATLNPEVLVRRIGLREGDIYDRRIFDNTVNQLLDLGVFKFVNYTFKRRTTDSIPSLDQYIYLTRSASKDVNVDVEAASRNGSQLGLGVNVRYGDRNLFGGAEDFKLSVGAAAGPQPLLTDPTMAVIGQEYEFSTSIALPRLIAPFGKTFERRAYYIPRTSASLRYQLTNRPDFQLQNFGLRLGYIYRANKLTTHSLYPINVSYTSLIGRSAGFDSLLNINPRLRETFSDNAIVGLFYQYNYNEQNVPGKKVTWYVDGGVKTSGNLASVFAKAPSDGGPDQIAGVTLSQFFKLYADTRRTWRYDRSAIATRFYAGAAFPYGNSDYIPFIEQFFAGGPNSVRAFPIRGVGPGKQLPPQLDSSNVNQSGDIRLELNAEYRFDIISFFEGALFVDAGNVWLTEDVSGEEPDGVFEFDQFYKQLAVGAGFGLRLNFDVIVIRLDAAVPIRRPWLPPAEAFDFSTLNLINSQNRKDNLRFHIAIGYPF